MLMSQQLAALILLALSAIIWPPTPPPPSAPFTAAATAAACHAHFNTPNSFDRLYGLIILNIYRSHFPKPSMFIQHLWDHSVPPPPCTLAPLFAPFLLFSPPFSLRRRLASLQPSLSTCHCLNKKERYFGTLFSPPLSSPHQVILLSSGRGKRGCVKPGRQADTQMYSKHLVLWMNRVLI